MAEFTHFNEAGRARMVDVTAKASTERVAMAQAKILLRPETLEKIQRRAIAKGDVLAVAQVAGVMGAKRTPDLIPMCHPLNLTSGMKHVDALATAFSSAGKLIRKAIDEADELEDADTADLFTAVSRDLDQQLWFLEAHLQGGE